VKNIMFDLEKGVEEGRDDAPAHQAHQDMADDDDQDHLTLELLRIDHQVIFTCASLCCAPSSFSITFCACDFTCCLF
jgi:hypothetical protein